MAAISALIVSAYNVFVQIRAPVLNSPCIKVITLILRVIETCAITRYLTFFRPIVLRCEDAKIISSGVFETGKGKDINRTFESLNYSSARNHEGENKRREFTRLCNTKEQMQMWSLMLLLLFIRIFNYEEKITDASLSEKYDGITTIMSILLLRTQDNS